MNHLQPPTVFTKQ